MITFKFNEKKTTQVASLFIAKEGGTINYMKLIKLLYLADRDALLKWERPLTGDIYVSMENGPVLSRVLDIINYGKAPEKAGSINPSHYWYGYISEPNQFKISLKDNPGKEKLSEREMSLIDDIYNEFGEFNEWELVDICHDILPEWEDPAKNDDGRKSSDINIEDIFNVESIPKEEIERITEEVDNLNFVKKILSIKD